LYRAVGGIGVNPSVAKERSDNTSTLPTHSVNQLLINSYVDLASEKIGGKALWASEEWFAAAENLLKPGRGTFQPGVVRCYLEYYLIYNSLLIEDNLWMDGRPQDMEL
jgi:hypothetical protein